MWDDDAVKRYEEWFCAGQGDFAFRRELNLINDLISGWPRRNQKLLEIGCGPGLFLRELYESGFDVYGLDSSPSMIKQARRRLGLNAVFHLGVPEHLPFDDNEFDFTAMITVLDFCENPALAVAEAVRVSRKGLLVCWLNRHSLHHLLAPKAGRAGILGSAGWFTAGEIQNMVSAAAGKRPSRGGSALVGPPWTWRSAWPFGFINGLHFSTAFGAFACLCVDLVDERPLTPLYTFKTETKPAP